MSAIDSGLSSAHSICSDDVRLPLHERVQEQPFREPANAVLVPVQERQVICADVACAAGIEIQAALRPGKAQGLGHIALIGESELHRQEVEAAQRLRSDRRAVGAHRFAHRDVRHRSRRNGQKDHMLVKLSHLEHVESKAGWNPLGILADEDRRTSLHGVRQALI
jgi:hypothetical protein